MAIKHDVISEKFYLQPGPEPGKQSVPNACRALKWAKASEVRGAQVMHPPHTKLSFGDVKRLSWFLKLLQESAQAEG